MFDINDYDVLVSHRITVNNDNDKTMGWLMRIRSMVTDEHAIN